ncbi:glycosyltransferase [Lyngbya aestuarii]|uniref:glycosyltransferase n=1 Tax=Lyngbya aestuarii TaxID=118322 RepID=UPI00403DEEBC
MMAEVTKEISAHNLEMEVTPLISVAICTYNRAEQLVLALEGISQQSLPFEYFEILIVDNGSTDNTQEICTRYQQQLPNLRYVYEPVPGLSKARNTAISQSHSKYIAYLDDDAIPCPTWLETIWKTFKTVKPEPICIGGPIYPRWESSPPNWIPQDVEYLFSLLDFGDQPHWLKLPKYPFGANMTFQRDALCRAGGFSESLGRLGKSNLLSGEEYRIYRILIEQGKGLLYYHPQAWVEHCISQERINLNWMLHRSYWQGRSIAVGARLNGKPLAWEWWQILGGLFKHRKPLTQILNLLQAWPDLKARTKAQVKMVQSWGYLSQVWLDSVTGNWLTTTENPSLTLEELSVGTNYDLQKKL